MQKTHELYVDLSMLRIENQRYKLYFKFFSEKSKKTGKTGRTTIILFSTYYSKTQ